MTLLVQGNAKRQRKTSTGLPATLQNLNRNHERLIQEVHLIESHNEQRFKTMKILQISILTTIGIFGTMIAMKVFGIIK